jgi:hypothetical protein
MPATIFARIGLLAFAAFATGAAYAAATRRAKSKNVDARDSSQRHLNGHAGKPAEAYSKHAIQHDLSTADAG